jgi:hypothetical protein
VQPPQRWVDDLMQHAQAPGMTARLLPLYCCTCLLRTLGTPRTALAPAVSLPSFPGTAGAYVYEYSVITSARLLPVDLAHDLAAATVQCVATNSL